METDARNGLGGDNCEYTGSCREPKMEIPVYTYIHREETCIDEIF
jgi:hypothetical protein